VPEERHPTPDLNPDEPEQAAPDGSVGGGDRDVADGSAEPVGDRDPDDRESPYELLRRGQALAAKRHFAQAAIVLGRAARLEPRKGSILEALGRALYNSGQHELARETFERLLEIDPSSDYGHYALGQSLKQLGRRREARTHLRIAVALAPTSRLYAGALRRLGPESPPGGESGGRRGERRGGGAGAGPNRGAGAGPGRGVGDDPGGGPEGSSEAEPEPEG
jgi:tetratricopeptide (TPR) repeat protein